MYTNPIMSADAYTISSFDFESPDAVDMSTYNFTFRRSPTEVFPDLASDSRIVVYGIKHFVDNYFNKIVTLEHLAEAQAFMKRANSFGGELNFPYEAWYEFITRYGGDFKNILNITSVLDGQVIFPNMPFIHVENSKRGFGPFAAHIEARILGTVSIASAAATLCRHWFERIKEEVTKDLETLGNPFTPCDVDRIARFFIHNFGSRACSSELESIMIGMSHLLSFNSTDNFDAAFQAWKEGCRDGVGTSILALAHRNVQTYETEGMCFKAAADATTGHKVRIASMVSDCYNFNNAVDTIISMAKNDSGMTYVSRPDSGDVYDCLETIYLKCVYSGMTNVVNGFHLPKNVRWIEGDSIKPHLMWDTFIRLRKIGCLPTLWGIFGIGGYIRNSSTRDALSAKYAVSRCGLSNRPVVKLSETQEKLSIPGYNYISSDYLVNSNPSLSRVINNHTLNHNFGSARVLTDSSWERAKSMPKDYGCSRTHLSEEITSTQDRCRAQHRKN